MQIPVQSTFMHYTWQCSTENSSTIWGLCIPVAGLLNGRAALLWHGKAGIYIEYLLFPQPPCQRRAALWFSPWTTSLDLLQSAVTSCSYHFPWMLLCFLACSFKSPWSVYILAYCKALWSKSGYASEYAQIRTMLKKLTVTFEFAPCRFAIINAMWSQITCL